MTMEYIILEYRLSSEIDFSSLTYFSCLVKKKLPAACRGRAGQRGRPCIIIAPAAGRRQICLGSGIICRKRCITSQRKWPRNLPRLCQAAGVTPSRVFPHNLRHLFARAFYALCRDIVKLADVLGHSSIDTTRIYLRTTGAEHVRQLERLHLLC